MERGEASREVGLRCVHEAVWSYKERKSRTCFVADHPRDAKNKLRPREEEKLDCRVSRQNCEKQVQTPRRRKTLTVAFPPRDAKNKFRPREEEKL